ncbi:MAG: hypothetical protein AAGI12_04680 [Pseudomonadota bacterium]
MTNSDVGHQGTFHFGESDQLFDVDRKSFTREESFVFETLIYQPKLRVNNDLGYVAIRRWNQKVKRRQLSAMRAVKKEPSRDFINEVSAEICRFADSFIGVENFDCVVPVPGGTSKNMAFSHRLAAAVGLLAGLPNIQAFQRISSTATSSHPINNAVRGRMRLKQVPSGNVLLIDDVVTSGSHLNEATQRLRAHCSGVVAVAWIGK